MTIHVNIGEAKTRLSALIAAAMRGEEVVLQKDGNPQVRLVPVGDAERLKREEIARRRVANIGRYKAEYSGVDLTVPPSMTEEEIEERLRRKFGEAAD